MGPRGVRRCCGTQRADPALRRLLGLPLVPRDGPRVLRGRRRRRRDEPPVRQHQGRPRGTPRCRFHLHGCRAGHERSRRLADDGVPHTRRSSVLRRHLLPEAQLLEPDGGDRRRVAQPSGRHPPERRRPDRRDRPHGADPAGLRSARHRGAQPNAAAAGRLVRPDVGRLRHGAEVPLDDEPRSGVACVHAAPSGRRPHHRDDFTRCDGQRWHVRPHRRWLCSLLGRREVVGAPFREDALRPGAADPRVPPRLPGVRRAALEAGGRGDGRVRVARVAASIRRVLLSRGRRFARRERPRSRGPVPHVDGRGGHRGARGRRCARPRVVRVHRCRQLRGPHDSGSPEPPRRPVAAARDRGGSAAAVRGAKPTSPTGARQQGVDRVERHDAGLIGRRRCRARTIRLARRRGRQRPLPRGEPARRR